MLMMHDCRVVVAAVAAARAAVVVVIVVDDDKSQKIHTRRKMQPTIILQWPADVGHHSN